MAVIWVTVFGTTKTLTEKVSGVFGSVRVSALTPKNQVPEVGLHP